MRGLRVMIECVSAFSHFLLTEKNESLLRSDGNAKFSRDIVKKDIYILYSVVLYMGSCEEASENLNGCLGEAWRSLRLRVC